MSPSAAEKTPVDARDDVRVELVGVARQIGLVADGGRLVLDGLSH
jgi:hypothetical protein